VLAARLPAPAQPIHREEKTMSNQLSGAAIAAAAAALFAAGSIVAPTVQAAEGASVHCAGINSCKGHSECKTAKNDCKGTNACKGQGWVTKSSAKECTDAGGKVAKTKGGKAKGKKSKPGPRHCSRPGPVATAAAPASGPGGSRSDRRWLPTKTATGTKGPRRCRSGSRPGCRCSQPSMSGRR